MSAGKSKKTASYGNWNRTIGGGVADDIHAAIGLLLDRGVAQLFHLSIDRELLLWTHRGIGAAETGGQMPAHFREPLNKSVTWVFIHTRHRSVSWVFIPTRRSREGRNLCPQRFRFLPSQERRSEGAEVTWNLPGFVMKDYHSSPDRYHGVRESYGDAPPPMQWHGWWTHSYSSLYYSRVGSCRFSRIRFKLMSHCDSCVPPAIVRRECLGRGVVDSAASHGVGSRPTKAGFRPIISRNIHSEPTISLRGLDIWPLEFF